MYKTVTTNAIIKLSYLIAGIICLFTLLLSCNDPQPQSSGPFPNSQNTQSNDPAIDFTQQQNNSSQGQNSQYLGDAGLPSNSQSTSATDGKNSTQRHGAVFGELNTAFIKEYCGIWQLYKRKPHDEPERLISEKQYLELKSDYTYDANGWTINGKGQWVSAFNWKSSGEPLNFLMFTNTKYNRPDFTAVSAELIEQNNSQMLKITELEEGDTDYYIRKQ